MRTLAILVTAFAAMSVLHAEGRNTVSWDNLVQLQAGQKVRVVERNRQSVEGLLAGISEETISVRARDQWRDFSRSEVVRVSARRHRSRALGMAIGIPSIAAGIFMASRVLPHTVQRGSYGSFAAGLFFSSSAVSGGLCAMFPPYRTVYRALQ